MKLTAKDLYDLKVIDEIIKEPLEITEENFKQITNNIKNKIRKEVLRMSKMNPNDIREERYNKFRNISGFIEKNQEVKNVIKR